MCSDHRLYSFFFVPFFYFFLSFSVGIDLLLSALFPLLVRPQTLCFRSSRLSLRFTPSKLQLAPIFRCCLRAAAAAAVCVLSNLSQSMRLMVESPFSLPSLVSPAPASFPLASAAAAAALLSVVVVVQCLDNLQIMRNYGLSAVSVSCTIANLAFSLFPFFCCNCFAVFVCGGRRGSRKEEVFFPDHLFSLPQLTAAELRRLTNGCHCKFVFPAADPAAAYDSMYSTVLANTLLLLLLLLFTCRIPDLLL